jgi:hypothetical protein
VLDFTDNEIKKLDNFPRFVRLSTLMLANNHISRISNTVGEQLANLETVILSNNRVEALSEVENLASCRKLANLCLVGNPVSRRQHYRLFVIHKLPQLKVCRGSSLPSLWVNKQPIPPPSPPPPPPVVWGVNLTDEGVPLFRVGTKLLS